MAAVNACVNCGRLVATSRCIDHTLRILGNILPYVLIPLSCKLIHCPEDEVHKGIGHRGIGPGTRRRDPSLGGEEGVHASTVWGRLRGRLHGVKVKRLFCAGCGGVLYMGVRWRSKGLLLRVAIALAAIALVAATVWAGARNRIAPPPPKPLALQEPVDGGARPAKKSLCWVIPMQRVTVKRMATAGCRHHQ